MTTTPAYRPDIDGLRAIAVVSVVVTHANLADKVQGGFVGVDIFFVISGYLISTILFKEVAGQRYSILNFYRRRVLRILPALLVMIAAVTAIAFLYLLPSELKVYSASAFFAILFSSNIFYWIHTGYFEAPAATQPLLHTWSLAIEEQFYIGFPIALYVIHRYAPKYLRTCVVVTFFVSLILSVAQVAIHQESAFYLVQFRTWELMMGAVVALGIFDFPARAAIRNVTAIAGLVLIAVPIFTYTDTTPFPGLAAVPPCLGTALIIQIGKSGKTLVSRALSLRPVVFVGLISYSFYLWHWPLLVLHSLGMPFLRVEDHARVENLALMALAFAVAILSWRFVEMPFREGRIKSLPTRTILATGASASAILAILSAGIWACDGFPTRFPPDATAIASYLTYDPRTLMRDGVCFLNEHHTLANFNVHVCLDTTSPEQRYVLLGDSTAANLFVGVSEALPRTSISQASAVGCKPVVTDQPGASPECVKLMRFMFNNWLLAHRSTHVLLSALWMKTDFDAVRATLSWAKAKGVDVTVIGPFPRYDLPLPRLLAQSIRAGNEGPVYQHRVRIVAEIDRTMESIARQASIGYVPLYRLMCPNEKCKLYIRAGEPLQFDHTHLTREGAEYVGTLIAGVVLPHSAKPTGRSRK